MNNAEMKARGIEFFGFHEKTGNSINLRVTKECNLYLTKGAMEIILRLVKTGKWEEVLAENAARLPDFNGRKINRLQAKIAKLQAGETTEVVETPVAQDGHEAA